MKIKYLVTTDERGEHINTLISHKYPKFIDETSPDLILLTGGDGALLHAIQKHNHLHVPFFGIASGTLNFLMNRTENPGEVIDRLANDKHALHFLDTTSIRVSLYEGNLFKFIGYAVNEITIGTSVMGYHHFSITSEDKSFDNFEIKGAGVEVCTEVGSTGFNFNLGGSVLPLGTNLWNMVGIICNRYLDDIIKIQRVEIVNLSDRQPPSILLDGVTNGLTLQKEQKLVLEKGEVVKIAFLNKDEFLSKRIEIASRYRK